MTNTPRDSAADADAADMAAEETEAQDIWQELDAADAAKAAADAGTAAPALDGETPEAGTDELHGWATDDADQGTAAEAAAPQRQDQQQEQRTPAEEALWANATPEQRAAYEALEHKLKSVKGRVAPLQRRYEELKAVVDAPAREKKSPKAAIAAIKDDYPEIAEPLLEALTPIEDRLNEEDQQHEAAREAATAELNTLVTEETQRLEEVHPDWRETLGGNKELFAAWVDDQPRRIRDAAIRNATTIVDAEQASEIVELFKQHLTPEPPTEAAADPTPQNRNPLNDRRQRQLGASASPTGRNASSRPLVSGIPEEGDSQQIWDGFEALDRQKAAANREYR